MGILIISIVGVAARFESSFRNELNAVQRLEKKGFRFAYHDTHLAWFRNALARLGINPRLGQRVRAAYFAQDPSSLRDLADMALLSELREFTLIADDEETDFRAVVTDELLAPVNCGVLTTIVVTGKTALSDRFLERFAGSEAIESIAVDDSLVTDQGLKHLARCPNMSTIGVEGCHVSNAGVDAVIALPALKRLFLDRTTVDSGLLPILVRGEHLTTVSVCGTAISLKEALNFRWPRSIRLRVGDPQEPFEVQLGRDDSRQ